MNQVSSKLDVIPPPPPPGFQDRLFWPTLAAVVASVITGGGALAFAYATSQLHPCPPQVFERVREGEYAYLHQDFERAEALADEALTLEECEAAHLLKAKLHVRRMRQTPASRRAERAAERRECFRHAHAAQRGRRAVPEVAAILKACSVETA